MVLITEVIEKMDLFILQLITNNMKALIQKLLFGYRTNPNAYTPKGGAKLTQKGGNPEAIHSALVIMQYNIRHAKGIN
jgi:hypothetical protein